MAATPRAPKQWCRTKTETETSLENWRQNLVNTLSLDAQFASFLLDGATWLKKTKNSPLRGFHHWRFFSTWSKPPYCSTKSEHAWVMLGQIASCCPVISRNTIIKNSTSMGSIWSAIRLHFGSEATGANFLAFSEIHLEHCEWPEDLYQRLKAFTEDNPLRNNSVQSHGAHARRRFHLSPNRSVEACHYYWSHEWLLSNPSRTRVDEILRRSHSVPWVPGVCRFSDGHAWFRNCLGRTHVSCTWRPYSRRSCCQDRRRSIRRSRLTTSYFTTGDECFRLLQEQTQTLRFQILSSTPNLLWSWAGFGTLALSRPSRIELQP